MKTIGFSVVGLGMGKARAKTVTQTTNARLVSVVDLNQTLAQQTASDFGCKGTTKIEDALRDSEVDVVMIMTPSGLHAPLAVQVLQAGKHCVVTKPMDVSVEKCDQMIAAQKTSGKLLAIDFQERYSDRGQRLKFSVQQGLMGRLILGEARLKWHRSQEYYDKGGWRGTWKMDGGGALANQTIHNIDLLVWCMGKPKSIIGRIGQFNHQIETEDLGMAMVEFESGAVGTILGTTTFPTNAYWSMEIHGTEGGVTVDLSGAEKWHFLKELADREASITRLIPHKNVVEDVVNALNTSTPPACDGAQGRLSVQLLNAIYESARNGSKRIDIA